MRPVDTPARLGGDEFAVLLENTDAQGAERAAQRLVDALSAKFSVSGREASVHASIGIALTGPHAMTAEELLRNADIAMYRAKSDENRRWALYEPALHRRLRHRHELASELEGSSSAVRSSSITSRPSRSPTAPSRPSRHSRAGSTLSAGCCSPATSSASQRKSD